MFTSSWWIVQATALAILDNYRFPKNALFPFRTSFQIEAEWNDWRRSLQQDHRKHSDQLHLTLNATFYLSLSLFVLFFSVVFFFKSTLCHAPLRLSHPWAEIQPPRAGERVHAGSAPSRLCRAAGGWPAGSPLAGPLLGGVVRPDHLRLGHHSVLVLREGVAV